MTTKSGTGAAESARTAKSRASSETSTNKVGTVDSTVDREATGGTTSKETSSEDTKAAENARDAESGDAASDDARKVKYIGGASTREMTRAQWKSAGIDQETVVFNEENGYTLPASDFSEDALERLRQDPGIKISG